MNTQNRPEGSHPSTFRPEPEERVAPKRVVQILDAIVEHTCRDGDDDGWFPALLTYVRMHGGPNEFGYEAVAVMVQFAIEKQFSDRFGKSSSDREWMEWVVDRLFEDPIATKRLGELWLSVIERVRNNL